MKRLSAKTFVAAGAIALWLATPVFAADRDEGTSDLWSEASLTTTYTLNRHLNPFKIDVEVSDGVATLSGEVESDVEKDLAEELARGTDGIRKVNNQLKVVADASEKSLMKQAAKNGDRDFMQVVEDANITAKVKSQLLWNGNTHGLRVNVDTNNAVVTLSGTVPTEAEANLAEQIARNTSEVRKVENKLTVGGEKARLAEKASRESDQAATQVSDAWITSKVKSSLTFNRSIDAGGIDVDTKNGVVILKGEVGSPADKERAISITRDIQGVKEVKDELDSRS